MRTLRVLAWPGPNQPVSNPYGRLLYSTMARRSPGLVVGDFTSRALLRSRWDVWHIHWPEYAFSRGSRLAVALKLGRLAALLMWARLRRVRVVWTIHNLRTHDGRYPVWEREFMRWFAGRVDAAIALTEGGARAAREKFTPLASRPIAVIPHGHYIDAYPNTLDRTAARRALGLEEGVRALLFVGRIAPYKGVSELVRAFRSLDDLDLRLLVAGEPLTLGVAGDVHREAARDRRVHLHLRPVADAEVQTFLNAADLVVLPYRELLNSGTALLALSFQRPVLVPEQGAMPELRTICGERWVFTYRGALDARALREALDALALAEGEGEALQRRMQEALDWSAIADGTQALFEEIVDDHRGEPALR